MPAEACISAEGFRLELLLTVRHDNILVREYGILPQSSEEVARVFKETMEFAGLLRHGILYDVDSEEGDSDHTKVDEIEVPPKYNGVQRESRAAGEDSSRIENASRQRYSVPLGRDGSVAILEVPLPIRDEYFKRLRAWATFMSQSFGEEAEVLPDRAEVVLDRQE